MDDLESADAADQLSHVLRLDYDLWQHMAYLKVKSKRRFWRRQFFGQLIAADRLNFGRPRVCSVCLKEQSVWWGIWDLGIVSVCSIHRCVLFGDCPACHRPLTWDRPAVELCRCGFDVRTIDPKIANSTLVAINALVSRAAGFPQGAGVVDLSFAARFVSVRSIAERFNTRSVSTVEYLKQNGKEVLAIHLPGKGKKLFAAKGPASEIAIPYSQCAKRGGAA